LEFDVKEVEMQEKGMELLLFWKGIALKTTFKRIV
jgi:hypothetical protein